MDLRRWLVPLSGAAALVFGCSNATSPAPPLASSADSDAEAVGSADDVATGDGTSETTPPIEVDCGIQINASISQQVPTVGIVTFTTDLGPVSSGYVEFGLDAGYGQRAPIDTTMDAHRTLLLGMTAETEYHYRITIHSGDVWCQSEDFVLATGPIPDEVPQPTLHVSAPESVAPGYLITSAQATARGKGFYFLIYNHLGQPVWWYHSPIGNMLVRAKLSWDGRYIYGRDGNPAARPGGQVVRVSLDGSTEERLTVDTGHHDFAVTPDNGVLFLTGGGGDACGQVQKWSVDGDLAQFYDIRNAFGDAMKPGADPCHCNAIHYHPEDASVTFSCLGQNAYVKVSQEREMLWVLGGNNGQGHFTGDVAWDRQHGHHMPDPSRILFLNNNGGGDSASKSSLAVELELDLENRTARRIWEYDGGEVTQTLGDVQRLANGNTLVTYCNAGILHEVSSAKQLVQVWEFTSGVGYTDFRESLYGVPPRP